MARVKLSYMVGNTEDFEALGIDIETARKSLNGTRTLIHRESLSDTEMNSIFVDIMQYKSAFVQYSDENVEALMLTPEWKAVE